MKRLKLIKKKKKIESQDKKKIGRINREKGYLYYIDGEGYIWQCKLKRGGKRKQK